MTVSATEFTISTSFYKKNEFFDVCEINGMKFALFSKELESNDDLKIDVRGYNAVFLAPIRAEKAIIINAVSVIALSKLISKTGEININASGKFISLGSKIKSYSGNNISGKYGVLFGEILRDRLEMLVGEFKEAIAARNGSAIVDALVDTFDAIENPEGENETIDVVKALEHFNISTET